MIGAGVDIDQTPIYLALRRTIAQHAHSLCKRTIDQHRAINQRDIPLVQAGVILLAANFILLNTIVDLVYARIDPRVKLSRARP